jgi:hypothetical protein
MKHIYCYDCPVLAWGEILASSVVYRHTRENCLKPRAHRSLPFGRRNTDPGGNQLAGDQAGSRTALSDIRSWRNLVDDPLSHAVGEWVSQILS